ncbi:MAG: hypothetical protein K2K35_00670 [Lachnospiraceae bacterium]|nr:hypothetical protein [Lachnospiraceae bacterium]
MGKIIKPIIVAGIALPVLFAGYSLNNSSGKLQQPETTTEKTVMAKEVTRNTTEKSKTNKKDAVPEIKIKTAFKGAEWTKEDEAKYALYKGSNAICPDRDNGGIYYVNWYYDNYLYYWKDGETKLVLDKWVSEICYMDGYIYCIYDETGKTYKADVTPSYEGKICSFNVNTGEFKELAETKAKNLAVCKDGLYYSWFTGPDAKEQKEEYGFYSFSDGKVHKSASKQENGTMQERYGKYAIVYRDGAYNIRNLENGSEQLLLPVSENAIRVKIADGKCYYNALENNELTLNVINLEDGKKQKLKAVLKISDMVQLNNSRYIYTRSNISGSINVYDPVKDKVKTVRVEDTYSASYSNYFAEYLHTDGEYLYTLVNTGMYDNAGTGIVVLNADGMDISETWSSLRYNELCQITENNNL